MKIDDYEKMLDGKTCRWCKTPLTDGISSYEHEGGYEVEGLEGKQWLYTVCPKCEYEWALGKLLRESRFYDIGIQEG
jgi:hypothetical protein